MPAKRIWRNLFFINFGITLLILFPFFWILLQRRAWFPAVHRLKKLWARLLLHNVGITYKVDYRFNPDIHSTYIFCPNHTSYLDVILSYLVIPNYFHFMAKGELASAPLFGIFFKKGMDIAFNRRSIKASHSAYQRASRDLNEGVSIAMFPEGTISAHAPQMLHFKNGPFKLALEKQIPIVPVTFKNNWLILPDPDQGIEGKPGKAFVVIHEPIHTKGLDESHIETLKTRVYEVISTELNHTAEKTKIHTDKPKHKEHAG